MKSTIMAQRQLTQASQCSKLALIQHGEEIGPGGELSVAVIADRLADQPQHEAAHSDEEHRSCEGAPLHTRRSRAAENSPVGRIISTASRITNAASGTNAECQ